MSEGKHGKLNPDLRTHLLDIRQALNLVRIIIEFGNNNLGFRHGINLGMVWLFVDNVIYIRKNEISVGYCLVDELQRYTVDAHLM